MEGWREALQLGKQGDLMEEGLQGGVDFNIGKRKEAWTVQESEVWGQEGAWNVWDMVNCMA